MKFAPHSILTVLFFALFINSHLLAAPFERSVSASRQFLIYGANTPLRGAIADVAEKTKKNLLGILQQRDEWKTPIVLNLQFPQANLPDLPLAARYFSQTGSGLKIQLDLTIGADVDVPAIQRELLRVILLEMIYRHHPDLAAGSDYVEPPAWLVEGLLAAAPGQERSPLIEAVTPLLASNNVIALPDFLRQNPALLDAPGQLLYRAYALALLQLLVEAPDGSARLAGYIENLSRASTDPLLDLMASFPAMANSSNMEARWKSKIAGLASARDYLLLSFAESDRRLDELLATRFPATAAAAKTLGVEDLLRNKISALHAAELKKLSRSFTLLAAAANPVMRPIVLEYQQILELLAADKRKGLASRLGRLKTTRARIVKRMNDVDDYMNWCEATKSSTASGAFANYLRAAHKGADSQPRRRDPLSVYLDSLEGQF